MARHRVRRPRDRHLGGRCSIASLRRFGRSYVTRLRRTTYCTMM
jgi:hypothetical protein